ncbi:phosphoheptose isomerase [Micromonospora globispora]|uniref:Phosphoheptose isomerase n=1 Tax=Micromonospora globispora TaxID=1450148 RepID=A0A317K4X7_9ACTN|nr:SIS domain-containing protein [Micromonospora globispora]PWU47354.1 phosphoheptose isomerase [Micromonospora globispora]PWU59427.1 phosphoheptose isomerase [Micromonospora globispora]RQX00735.1 phosphoheptose isomerase [Micromonospora globispora]
MSARVDGAIGALYPFLDTHPTDVDEVLAAVARSTAEKAAEIVALRESLVAEHGQRLLDCAGRCAAAFRAGGTLFAFGNGGSSTDAQDVAQLFLNPPKAARPLPAISLTHDVALITALSNDVGFEVVFARQLAAFGRAGDIAVGLSTSGGSNNVLRAFEEAARRGMLTVGIAGYDGGRMAESEAIDHLFVVPSASVHRVQEAQTTVYHVLWELTQQALADER